MALISLRQLLDHAAEHHYGLPAFNVNNMEQIHAIMQAAEQVDSPVILQAWQVHENTLGSHSFVCWCMQRLSNIPISQFVCIKTTAPRLQSAKPRFAVAFPV